MANIDAYSSSFDFLTKEKELYTAKDILKQ